MKIVTATHQGLVRLNNEDAVLADEQAGWIALADGMGGLLAGEEASEIAAVAVKQAMAQQAPDAPLVDVEALMFDAHQRVKNHAEAKNYLGKMGTTLTLWSWRSGSPQFCHVGDSRLYAMKAGHLHQLTQDHTVAQRMVDEGVIAASEKDSAPHQNVLTQALGMPGMLRPQSGSTPLEGRLLLCSDGLTDLVSDAHIAEVLACEDAEECVGQLVKCALDQGGRDNVSVGLVCLS